MNRGYEGNGNGSRHPDQIMAEIERTRREMDSTLGAIEERLTPGQLLDQGMDYLKNSGAADYARNLRGSVSSNPLPIALVGIGLAWLAAADRMDRTRRGALASDTPYRNDWDTTGPAGTAQGKEGWKDKASHLKDDASGAIGSMKERAAGAMSAGRQTLDETSRMARERMEQVRGGYQRIVEEQPLALGAIGLALGAVLAAVLPRTRKEEELLAGTREKVADKASELAKQASDKGKEVLEKGKQQVEQARQAARPSGDTRAPGDTKPSGENAQEKHPPATGAQLGATRPPSTQTSVPPRVR